MEKYICGHKVVNPTSLHCYFHCDNHSCEFCEKTKIFFDEGYCYLCFFILLYEKM